MNVLGLFNTIVGVYRPCNQLILQILLESVPEVNR